MRSATRRLLTMCPARTTRRWSRRRLGLVVGIGCIALVFVCNWDRLINEGSTNIQLGLPGKDEPEMAFPQRAAGNSHRIRHPDILSGKEYHLKARQDIHFHKRDYLRNVPSIYPTQMELFYDNSHRKDYKSKFKHKHIPRDFDNTLLGSVLKDDVDSSRLSSDIIKKEHNRDYTRRDKYSNFLVPGDGDFRKRRKKLAPSNKAPMGKYDVRIPNMDVSRKVLDSIGRTVDEKEHHKVLPHPEGGGNQRLGVASIVQSAADDITLVTAYFNLGTIDKIGHYYTPETYIQWMKVFRWISNPLVVFVEDDMYAQIFSNLRLDKFANRTKIIKVSRSQLWAFSLLGKIKEIYSDPNYPKHVPNTVLPEYPCAMHAKYELMERAVLDNPFKTKYFTWLDVGLFRELSQLRSYPEFSLSLPPNFDDGKVAYTEVMSFIDEADVEHIFRMNMVWVCGCFFLAKAPVMLRWVREYMRFTEHYLSLNMMNTDQQVIYAMFQNARQVAVQIQTYKGDGRYNEWFHLGYLCKEMGHKRDGMFVIRKEFNAD